MSVESLRQSLEQRKGKRQQIESTIQQTKNRWKEAKKILRLNEKALEIMKQVAIETQRQLQYHISDITSTALEAVFDDPYELIVEFVERRNKTECDIFFSRDDSRIDPLEASGYGAVDVASFALQVASWSMENPRSRPVLILDEPFKHLKGEEANQRMLSMVQEISKKLGLQIIMISDERVSREATLEATDKLFEVQIKKGKSKIKD